MHALRSATVALALWALAVSGIAHDGHNHETVARAATDVPEYPVLTRSNVETLYGLIDQSGQPVSRDDFRGRFALVVFGYTG